MSRCQKEHLHFGQSNDNAKVWQELNKIFNENVVGPEYRFMMQIFSNVEVFKFSFFEREIRKSDFKMIMGNKMAYSIS